MIEFDSELFRANFNKLPFSVTHNLADDPLFQLPQLVELARGLPAKQVEFNAGNVPVELDPEQTPQTGLSIEETLRRIEDCGSWMVLKNVEAAPEYARILDLCIDAVRNHSDLMLPGIHLKEAFIFVSSPNAVTPFHIDPEHNFLLQIRGRKTMFVFDPADRKVISDQALERFHSGAHRNLTYRNEWQDRASRFELLPGQGVHVPVTAPHWVRNEDKVSISFSVTFRSNTSIRQAGVHQMNHMLRGFGLHPKQEGLSLPIDKFKHQSSRAISLGRRCINVAKRPFRRSGPGQPDASS